MLYVNVTSQHWIENKLTLIRCYSETIPCLKIIKNVTILMTLEWHLPRHRTCSKQLPILVPFHLHVRVSDGRQLALEVRRLRLHKSGLWTDLSLELWRSWRLLDEHVACVRLWLDASLYQFLHRWTLDRGLAAAWQDIVVRFQRYMCQETFIYKYFISGKNPQDLYM